MMTTIHLYTASKVASLWGAARDYLFIHRALNAPRDVLADRRSQRVLHNSWGITLLLRLLGDTCNGHQMAVRFQFALFLKIIFAVIWVYPDSGGECERDLQLRRGCIAVRFLSPNRPHNKDFFGRYYFVIHLASSVPTSTIQNIYYVNLIKPDVFSYVT